MMNKTTLSAAVLVSLITSGLLAADKPAAAAFEVDKEKKTITIPAKIAPRKINDERYKEIYPIEVFATAPFPKGEKSHETVITIDVVPSEIHKALESFGLKPGKPAVGEEDQAQGPELKITLQLPTKTIPIEKALVDKKTGKTLPALRWTFCGSEERQPDPNKPDKVYGADMTKTLIAVFPVTAATVIQSNLTRKDEPLIKMETNKAALPPEGTDVKLIITATGK